ncbi:MAG: hypothetical protein J6C26_02485 [Clostridia bacterium]|nr:hypothetical protein [Clostridia bacterium]
MTDIVFSFDTEDLANIAGFDGILRTAEILRKHNVRGCFQVVGRLAELLEKHGRTDIIEALKYHEIDTHSLGHSLHPTINECTDLENFDEAYDTLMARERESAAILNRIFGVEKIHSACPPGNSVSYVAHYVYHDMGIPVYCGDILCDRHSPHPAYFCNLLCTEYDLNLEGFLMVRDEKMVPQRLRTEEEIREKFDWVAANKDLYICYHHPSMSMYNEWWDMVNCYGENAPADQWRESKRNPVEMTEGYYKNFDFLVGMIKNDPRFRITTYEKIGQKYGNPCRKIRLKDLPALKAQLEESFHPVTLPYSYCIADIFHACRAFLCGETEYVCGDVRGFLEEPFSITSPVTVTKDEMIQSAKRMASEGWLPRSVIVGSSILGAADWLRAALGVLCGEESVTVAPDGWQIDLDQFPALRDLNLKLKWVDTKNLMDNHLSRRARLQSWTIRLPEGVSRKFF